MSIPQLPSFLYSHLTVKRTPCEWYVLFTDDTYAQSPTLWSSFSDMVPMGGQQVWMARKPVRFFSVVQPEHPEYPLHIESFQEEGMQVFSFKRNRLGLSFDSTPEWLYTCFGYVHDGQRVTLYSTPQGNIHELCQPDSPFWS